MVKKDNDHFDRADSLAQRDMPIEPTVYTTGNSPISSLYDAAERARLMRFEAACSAARKQL